MTSGELQEGLTAARRALGQTDTDQRFVRLEVGRHVGEWPVRHRDLALPAWAADRETRVGGRGDAGQLGRRIEVAQTASHGPAVASLEMTDLGQRLRENGEAVVDRSSRHQIALAGHRPDFDRIVGFHDPCERRDTVQVDHMVGHRVAHVEHRHQRLTSGQQLGVLLVRQQAHQLVDGRRIVIGERRRLHSVPLFHRFVFSNLTNFSKSAILLFGLRDFVSLQVRRMNPLGRIKDQGRSTE